LDLLIPARKKCGGADSRAPLPVIYEDSPLHPPLLLLLSSLLSSAAAAAAAAASLSIVPRRKNLRLLSTKHGRMKQNVLHEKKKMKRRFKRT
jgi:hypothetical protein